MSFVAGTFILTDTINATFTGIFSTASAGVAVTVHGHPISGSGNSIGFAKDHPVPTSLLDTVRAVPGVKDAIGNIFRNGATLIGDDGKPIGGNGPPTFGGNWLTDTGISPYHLRSGRPPTQPTDVVVDAGTAAKHGLTVGQSIAIVFQGGAEQHFTISGIAGYGSADNIGGATIVLFSEATAEQVMDAQGKYDSILVSAQSGVTDVVLRERIAAVLPSYAEAETGQQAAQAAEQSTEDTISTFIGTPLLIFAFISLFVGSFLIINTFNILVAQRTRELALLRALGATRAQVLRSVLIEAALTGLVASILGFAVGILIAKALLSVFGSASTAGITLLPRTFIVAVLVGTIVTVIAASLPARRATRISPVEALAEALPETQPLPRLRIGIGLAVFLLGCAGTRRRAVHLERRKAAAHRRGIPRSVRRCGAARATPRGAGRDRARMAGAPPARRSRHARWRERAAQPATHGAHRRGADDRPCARHLCRSAHRLDCASPPTMRSKARFAQTSSCSPRVRTSARRQRRHWRRTPS